MNRNKVLVIGAGAAGLCAAKHISSSGKFICEVFEQTGTIGGTWAYTDEVYKDKHGLPVHTSMYKHLRTNIPVEIMPFLDYPFHPTRGSFMHRSEVLQYLKNYAEHHDLYKYIKFHKEVEKVLPVPIGSEIKWKVSITDLPTRNSEEHVYDAVMVCNGHYSEPNIPTLPGIENFKGIVIHSHDYREPETFAGKKVVIWGGAFSGFDISQEISSVAESVVICHRMMKDIPERFPENVKLAANIVSASENGFKLEDGTICKADSLIYCTGYLYSFPFLTKDCKIEVNDNHVKSLYKHLVNIEYPTMCLVGLLHFTIPFMEFYYQVQFFLKLLDQAIELPTKYEMERENEQENEKRCKDNIPERHAHSMHHSQWKYFEDLANLAGIENFPPVTRNIFDDSIESMRSDISGFKNYDYKILDKENFEKVLNINKD